MPIYLLTNKVTFARAVVIAPDAEQARRMHPTNDYAYRTPADTEWQQLRHQSTYPYNSSFVHVPPPEGWPIDVSLVHVDMLASRVESQYDGRMCHAYTATAELRLRGDGPDDTWGGYPIDRLATFEDHRTQES